MIDDKSIVFVIAGLFDAVLTWLLLKNLNYFLMTLGVAGIDINKPSRVRVPEEAGVSIFLSFAFALWILGHVENLAWVVSIIVATGLACLVGFIDHFRNLRPIPKLFYGFIIGLLYYLLLLDATRYTILEKLVYLILIAAIYSAAINAFNLLAGFNGLESGVTVISSAGLAIYYYLSGYESAAAVLIMMAVAYGVFWLLNKYPAQIFLGDSGTLMPASVYVGLSVFTGQWLTLAFVLAPHFLNAAIKFMSTGISSRSDHTPLRWQDGRLHLPERNYWSLIRLYLALAGPRTEQQIVYFVYALEFISCSAMLVLLRGIVR